MTFEDDDMSHPQNNNHDAALVDLYDVPPRDKAMIHPAVDPPTCETCVRLELAFFDPNCPGCRDLLQAATTTIPEIFAILRQWTPQTQRNVELFVQEILRRGAHVNDRDGLTDMTLLHYASKAGVNGVGSVDDSCRVVRFLIARGSDVFIRCRWTNMTALHYATYFDISPVIAILLDASKAIDVDSLCSEFDGGTPLHIAAANLCYESAKVLLDSGANPGAKDDLRRIPVECIPDDSAFDPSSDMAETIRNMRKLLNEAKALVPPDLSTSVENIHGKVTLHSMGLKIGEKVVVGGVKFGILKFCGPTEFAPGIWAGIELEEAAGKNDGSVGGISYFSCSPKYGIFAPVNKISKQGALSPSKPTERRRSTTTSYAKVDTSHITAKVDTGLKSRSRSGSMNQEMVLELEIGDRVLVAGQRKGVIQFSGRTDFAPGWWYGVELDKAVGKNDGTVNGKTYFTCQPKHGVFAPISRLQKLSDLHGSRESLDSLPGSLIDSQRKLSSGTNGTPPNKNTITRPWSSGSVRRSYAMTGPSGDFKLAEGMSVFCNNELGIVRYIGEVEFADGVWLGVELRTPKGKNDGSVQGRRYFNCKPNHGLVVRPSKVTVRGINGAKLLGEMHGEK